MAAENEQLTLKKLRERAGLTQRKLAEILDVAVTTVSSWERGAKQPTMTFAEVKRVMDVLNCTIEELVEATRKDEA